ncbi:MAG: recombinase [Ferruginibacter sp.]|nr:recombinase [Ferruginibacter sp.]
MPWAFFLSHIIADTCGIDKNLTFQLPVTLLQQTISVNNDVPIETVSKMPGSTNLRTTQHYATILVLKLSKDRMKLKRNYLDPRDNWKCN